MKDKRKIKGTLFLSIIIILILAIYGSLELSINDFKQKDICPKLMGMPACYLVALLFTTGLAAHLTQKFDKAKYIFYLAIGLVFMMALKGTLTELSGTIVCPRTNGGTPMCFISLGICTSLLSLKYFELFINSKPQL